MPPLLEGMGIDNARFLEQTHKFMNLMWPRGKDQFYEGEGKHYASFAASNSHVLRFLKFKPQDTESKSIRLSAHKDISLATIVHQIHNPALEVEENDGTWIAIEPEVSIGYCNINIYSISDIATIIANPTKPSDLAFGVLCFRRYSKNWRIGDARNPQLDWFLDQRVASGNRSNSNRTDLHIPKIFPLLEKLCLEYLTKGEVVNSYAKILGDLNELVLEMVFQSYGAGKHYASFAASISHVLRFLKFKLRDTESKSIRLPAHKDLSFATIVHQIDNPGLEVETNDGTWIAIEPDVSHFVFLACEGMQVWSNDRVKACKHRVNISGDKDRYSMGLFTFNNGVIQVPEEMVDDEHPLLYNPFDHPEFVRFFTRSVMTSNDPVKKQFDNPLKAFCGV
ncbi:hypothetical protein FEM48_Zijuj05G0026700 [Ziziphus jujuba var. spinosa]|uniref:Isopenicillin N synthase-like Fe(2+) 2OG dioxygenase domain-containing protein n=1 Tax=Ziziphus jujuba var. spinosa TaxID=714518 RepID=A0A978VCC3_ZIZJJ|nr:hypothetical protein FEM48_Zijuj05G0026700 [Ziziphus jujuba var. spinosa]